MSDCGSFDAAWWLKHGGTVRARLTRAERNLSNDPIGALTTAGDVLDLMESHGYPDWWSRVDRLALDARMSLMRAEPW